MVGMLIVKLVPADFDAKMIAGGTVGAVLQVTLSLVPSSATGVTIISLFAVTAVVLITQVPVEAFVAQENAPAGADPQATRDGLAAVPTAAQFEIEAHAVAVSIP